MNPYICFDECGPTTTLYEECIHVELYKIRTSAAKIDNSTSTDALITTEDKGCQCPDVDDGDFEHSSVKVPSCQTLISDRPLFGGNHIKINPLVLPPKKQPEKDSDVKTSLGNQQQRQDGLRTSEFDDIAVYFTKEEWEFLNEKQKKLYVDVITENYQFLLSLGWTGVKPAIISKIEQGEELCCTHHSQPKTEGSLNLMDETLKRNPSGGGNIALSRKSDHVTKDDTLNQRQHGSLFTCPLCKNCFTFNSSLVESQTKHTGDETLICTECSKYKHGASVSDKRSAAGQSFQCSECDKSFASALDLEAHQRLHSKAKSLSCAECGLSFKQKSHLMVHQMTHKEEKPAAGPENGKCMIVCNCAVKHNQKEVYACLECGHTFNRKSDLVRHRIIHTEEKPFACPECEMCFKQRSDLVRHQVIHMAGRPRACGECEKWFKDKPSLQIHQKTHASETSFICTVCGKCFYSRQDFAHHRRSHTEERPFSCPECGKTFANNQNLLRHKRTHTADKRFQCSECGKCFFNKMDLVIHQNVHFRDYI